MDRLCVCVCVCVSNLMLEMVLRWRDAPIENCINSNDTSMSTQSIHIYLKHFICSIFGRTIRASTATISNQLQRWIWSVHFLLLCVFFSIVSTFLPHFLRFGMRASLAHKLCKYVIELMRLTALDSTEYIRASGTGYDQINCTANDAIHLQLNVTFSSSVIWRLNTISNAFHIKT